MSKSAGPSLIHVPTLFSVVEPGVYRCASPTASQVGLDCSIDHEKTLADSKVPFLASLGLKTILSLTPEYPTKHLLSHIKASSITLVCSLPCSTRGASACARRTHIWKGTSGVLSANDRKMASHRTFCSPRLPSDSDTITGEISG
jgi:hypothetical protein